MITSSCDAGLVSRSGGVTVSDPGSCYKVNKVLYCFEVSKMITNM